jgi:endonuclease/exonuclease/phosphatase family metal-dependent hydrolase
VLVGDFNFSRSDRQFRALFDVLRGRGVFVDDLLASSPARDQHTYSAQNPLVMWPESSGRIDHAFAVSSVGGATVAWMTRRVKLVSDTVRSDLLVSDHYPVELELEMEAIM